jgi:glutamyl-tRNA reductase
MISIETASSQISESDISETLASLRLCFELVRRGEIQRVQARLANLTPDQENAIDSLSHALIERLLQSPLAMLKNASTPDETLIILATVRRIFNLRT